MYLIDTEVEQRCKHRLCEQILTLSQQLFLDVKDTRTGKQTVIQGIIHKIVGLSFGTETDDEVTSCFQGLITEETEFEIEPIDQLISLKRTKTSKQRNLFKKDFNFEQLGIGGLDKVIRTLCPMELPFWSSSTTNSQEFNDIFRRAFASRIFPPHLVEELGITHVKGMLLYGPPGTGKTLIARQIGKALRAKEPKVIR